MFNLDEVYEVFNSDTEKSKRIGVEIVPNYDGTNCFKIQVNDLRELLELASGTDGQYGCIGSVNQIDTSNLSDDELNSEMDKKQSELKALLEERK